MGLQDELESANASLRRAKAEVEGRMRTQISELEEELAKQKTAADVANSKFKKEKQKANELQNQIADAKNATDKSNADLQRALRRLRVCQEDLDFERDVCEKLKKRNRELVTELDGLQ